MAFEEDIKKALQKGATFRVITQKLENETYPMWVTQTLARKKTSFKIKTQPNTATVISTIYDDNEVAIALDAETDLLHGAHFWSNNSNIVALSRHYFDSLWAQLEKRA